MILIDNVNQKLSNRLKSQITDEIHINLTIDIKTIPIITYNKKLLKKIEEFIIFVIFTITLKH